MRLFFVKSECPPKDISQTIELSGYDFEQHGKKTWRYYVGQSFVEVSNLFLNDHRKIDLRIESCGYDKEIEKTCAEIYKIFRDIYHPHKVMNAVGIELDKKSLKSTGVEVDY